MRAFKDVVVKDTHDNTITVRQSSAVHCMGPAGSSDGPFAWIFIKDNKGEQAKMHLGHLQSVSPHMTPKQARQLAKALIKFADWAEK